MGLRYEDNVKLRASLVLDAYQNQLNEMKVEKLNYAEQEKYQKVSHLLAFLKGVKVVDAPVLLRIYNMYKCQL